MREWKHKYDQHKYRAERRGIPFELTFKQWLKIWQDSGHLRERGHRQGQYVMARFVGGGVFNIRNGEVIPAGNNQCYVSCEARTRRSSNKRHFSSPWIGSRSIPILPRARRSCIPPHWVGTPVPPHHRILRPDSFGSIECQTPYAWEAKREARSSRASAGETHGLVDGVPRSRRFRYTPHRSTTRHIWPRWSRVHARPIQGPAPASHQD